MTDRFMIEGPDVPPTRVCLERNAQCFKGSLQVPGRKKPLRHLIGMSEEFASGNMSSSSGRTLLAGSDKRFIWASIAHIYGVPGVPEWASWFREELKTHHAISQILGIGCDPVMVQGTKEQFLDWLSWGSRAERPHFRPNPVRFIGRSSVFKTSSPGPLSLDCLFRQDAMCQDIRIAGGRGIIILLEATRSDSRQGRS